MPEPLHAGSTQDDPQFYSCAVHMHVHKGETCSAASQLSCQPSMLGCAGVSTRMAPASLAAARMPSEPRYTSLTALELGSMVTSARKPACRPSSSHCAIPTCTCDQASRLNEPKTGHRVWPASRGLSFCILAAGGCTWQRGKLCSRGCNLCTIVLQLVHGLGTLVKQADTETATHQISCHARAHVAQPNEAHLQILCASGALKAAEAAQTDHKRRKSVCLYAIRLQALECK